MRRFLLLSMVGVVFLHAVGNTFAAVSSSEASSSVSKELTVFVASYVPGDKEGGVYSYSFDMTNGALKPIGKTVGLNRLSFLAVSPKRQCLYGVLRDGAKGQIQAFGIDPKTFALKPIGLQPSQGDGPCHVIVDANDQYLLVANYSSGSVAVFPLDEDGVPLPASEVVQHEGASGVNKSRQSEVHPHMVQLSPANDFAYVPDLGLDRIKIYCFTEGKLQPATPSEAVTPPGAGPRHFRFHTAKPWAYVINELDSTIECYHHDFKTGALNSFQVISTLPEFFKEKNHCADIHIDPSGRYLYGSNRGHDSIAIFSIDPKNGQLKSLGYQATGGVCPRNFAIDPSGKFLLVANKLSSSIQVFKIKDNGTLASVGKPVKVPTPVCIEFLVR